MNDDAALGYVLGTLDEDELAQAERAIARDPSFAAAVERARAQVGEIARGIELVAAQASARGPARARPRIAQWPRILGAAAAVVLLAVGSFAVVRSVRREPPQSAGGVPGAGTLEHLVGGAESIVTGTVVEVLDGALGEEQGGLPYRIAIVDVDGTIRGAPMSRLAAFDYTYGVPWVERGQRVLLFLTTSAGTVHETISPPHLQVVDGEGGSYVIQDGKLVGASFTLDDVRAAAR